MPGDLLAEPGLSECFIRHQAGPQLLLLNRYLVLHVVQPVQQLEPRRASLGEEHVGGR